MSIFKNSRPLTLQLGVSKIDIWTLTIILGDFYGHARVPDTLKPLHTQFQGTRTNLYFFRTIDDIFIVIFVFLMSENPIKPNFKDKGQF